MAATVGIEAYPLYWPINRPRTDRWKRRRSKFDTSFAVARDEVLREVGRMGGRSVVITSNLALRRDGLPLAGQRQPEDCGVAVYFLDRQGRQRCFACDRWDKIEDNIQAVRKTIEALRGISRWGTGDMVEAAFQGFAALPPAPGPRPWWEVFGVQPHQPADDVTRAYRGLAVVHHPDRGGDPAKMLELNAAYDRFKKERGL